MTPNDVAPFFIIGMAICAIMMIVSLLRFKTRGPSACVMAAAFAVLGIDMFLVKIQASQPVIIGGCGLLVILLGLDFAARSAYPRKDQPR
jgi:hypothetical protein